MSATEGVGKTICQIWTGWGRAAGEGWLGLWEKVWGLTSLSQTPKVEVTMFAQNTNGNAIILQTSGQSFGAVFAKHPSMPMTYEVT